MGLELFAAMDNPGFVVGVIFAVLISGALPITVGASYKQPILGIVGGICAGGTAVLLGCLGGLPVAAIFIVIIIALGGGNQRKYGRYRTDYDEDDEDEDEDDEYERRRRKKRNRDYDEEDDDYDDRPRRRRDRD